MLTSLSLNASSLIRSITYSLSLLDCLFVLYTELVKPKLEYASSKNLRLSVSIDFLSILD
jgi:hypothetical protein